MSDELKRKFEPDSGSMMSSGTASVVPKREKGVSMPGDVKKEDPDGLGVE